MMNNTHRSEIASSIPYFKVYGMEESSKYGLSFEDYTSKDHFYSKYSFDSKRIRIEIKGTSGMAGDFSTYGFRRTYICT